MKLASSWNGRSSGDETAADAEEGVIYHAISSGEFKAEGLPCVPMTDEEKTALQSLCDQFYGLFTATVAKGGAGGNGRTDLALHMNSGGGGAGHACSAPAFAQRAAVALDAVNFHGSVGPMCSRQTQSHRQCKRHFVHAHESLLS